MNIKDLGFKDTKSIFRQTDILLLGLCVLLSIFGALMVCTATYEGDTLLSRDTFVMVVALLLGVVASFIISLIDYDIIYKLWPVKEPGPTLQAK